ITENYTLSLHDALPICYKIFDFYKFRSMRVGADAELKKLAHLNQYSENSDKNVFFKLKNDPRVTKFGAFLRRTSLDEIPQLFNVDRKSTRLNSSHVKIS